MGGIQVPLSAQPSMTDYCTLTDNEACQILSALTWPVEPRQVLTAGLPIGTSVDLKLQNLIWAEQYVSFVVFLFWDARTKYSLKTENEGEFRIVQHERRITNITQWAQAFHVFTAVYIQKPSLLANLPVLLTYGREVKGTLCRAQYLDKFCFSFCLLKVY